MTSPDPVLAALAEEPRDQAIGGVLEALARALETGADVVCEPELRDAHGAIARTGPLNLPRRDDLAVTDDGHTHIRSIESPEAMPGAPVVVATDDGFVAEIGPFRWDAADLTVFAPMDQPDWTTLRRWFLEWFQSRHSEVAPELLGALHSLDGPRPVGRGWAFTVDFGSAPVACLSGLIEALAEAGAVRMRLGQV